MPMEDRFYRDTVTFWAPSVRDEYGKITYAAPLVFKGWWEDRIVDMLGPKGETFVSRSSVHCPDSVPIILDGWMFLGSSSAPDPTVVPLAYRILHTQKLPDLRNLSTVNVAIL